ncbi:MAG TPA: pilus assembly PilX N-terminal domain-containing protein, partial [Candidatus Limnocylindrales bacterium]|nr:pilus assembly PilX N-terminal domain-containing protein [Candidatus Limnocylindrales bacterium]
MRKNKYPDQGSVIVSILVITLFLSVVISGLIVLASSNLTRARNRVYLLQAQYAAESGVDAAIAQLNAGNDTYTGSASEVLILSDARYKSTYTMNVSAGSSNKQKVITAIGRVFAPANAPTAQFERKIEVIAERSSTTTTTSILSRNIIETGSSVKDLKARDVYVNNYINMNKNVTNFIAENITVAGRNTGATNCSIGGTGNLVKPSSFSTAGQTKTKLNLAYNNCISPPGNTSDGSFNVLPNQTNIAKIQSTLIPWNYYMDTTYQNAPGGCNDWTTGSFPRSIPSTGNTKKTHYPDSASNVSTSCGTSGDLFLATGQYNIKNNVHLRANLCAASACNPTFYNPDSGATGIKYVFIEGTINFGSLTTAAGSGPIVFITYGADPASLSSVCPTGGSLYLGNGGNTSAPAAYLLAQNGLCLDK